MFLHKSEGAIPPCPLDSDGPALYVDRPQEDLKIWMGKKPFEGGGIASVSTKIWRGEWPPAHPIPLALPFIQIGCRRSNNLDGQVVIQGHLKMKVLLLFRPKSGGVIPPLPSRFRRLCPLSRQEQNKQSLSDPNNHKKCQHDHNFHAKNVSGSLSTGN